MHGPRASMHSRRSSASGMLHEVVTASSSQRIVSLVPSATESVVAFGCGSMLVGCTRYCTEPAAALVAVARIGGTKNPARERIAALRPDLVLGNAEENRAEDLAWLRARFAVLEQTPCTVDAATAALHELAVTLAAEPVAQPILQQITEQVAAARAAAAARPPRVFYAIWRRPWMGANATTFIADLLRTVGATNVCADDPQRYPVLSPEAVCARAVDAVLLPSEPWAFDAVQRDELLAARTFGSAALSLCDGRDFCWHGVHMATGIASAAAVVRALSR